MEKAEKRFDAVREMRRIREELGRELAGKSFEEQSRYIRERIGVRSQAGPGDAATEQEYSDLNVRANTGLGAV